MKVKVPITDEKERKLREYLLKAISDAHELGLGTDKLVITVLDLAETVAEGCVVAADNDKRARIREALSKALSGIANRISRYVPDPAIEAQVKAKTKAGKSRWETGREDVLH